MATTQHYIWAAGHFVLLISALRYLLAAVLLRGASAWWYKTSFIGALVSYVIVVHKSLGMPTPSLAWVQRAFVEENVQYLLLASFWWFSKPVAFALIPYTIFSLFHALTFARTTVMPQLLPQGSPSTAGGPPTPHPLAKKLHSWVKANYNPAMKAVAFAELLIMLRVTLGALLFQNSLIMPLVFAHFLRQRYYQSAFTRDAVAYVNNYIEGHVRTPGMQPMVVKVWDSFKTLLARWAGNVLASQPAAGARRQ